MARDTFEDWIPVELGDQAIQALAENSAVEQYARRENMISDTKQVPRDGGFTVANVAKGGSYGESTSTNDYVELIARKVGGAERIAEEDLNDPTVDVLATKRAAAARALAIDYDNSSLAVTAAGNGTTVNFNSVYYTLSQNGSGSQAAYVANANITQVTATNMITITGYDALNTMLNLYEEGDFFDDPNTVVIAHNRFKKYLRGMKDSNGDPVLVATGRTVLGRPTYEVFGYPLSFTFGARTSAVDSQSPTGNPLLIVANKNMLLRGVRALAPQIPADGVGFGLQRANVGIGFLSDESLMKAAIRRAFALGTPFGASLIEVTP